jgi:hypothetical protein
MKKEHETWLTILVTIWNRANLFHSENDVNVIRRKYHSRHLIIHEGGSK